MEKQVSRMENQMTNQVERAKMPDYMERIEELREEMVEDLKTLVRCPSVVGPPQEGAPFGTGPAEALAAMLAIGRREGMTAVSVDGMAGYIEHGAPAEELFGILCHLDVVPEGNGWTYGAFDPVVEDGRVYGRGTIDDKGPAIAAFYALKALKDCGYTFQQRVRMIFGLNEETGEESLQHYKRKEEIPGFSIVPDSDFPVVRAEKGILTFDLLKRFGAHRGEGPTIRSIRGGAAANMVPDEAEALVEKIGDIPAFLERVERFAADRESRIAAEDRGNGAVLVRASGTSAHGSTPWKGVNAISILMALLRSIGCDSTELQELLDFYDAHIAFDFHGERMGINLRDQESGNLVFNVGMIEMDEAELRLTVNVRIPVTFGDEEVSSGMSALLAENNFRYLQKMYQPPLYYQADDPRIQRLMAIYRKHTGDLETEPLIIGGGTYARQIDNAVAFGALYPGDEDRMHGADEYVSIDRLVQTAKIYAETIYDFAVKPGEAHSRSLENPVENETV